MRLWKQRKKERGRDEEKGDFEDATLLALKMEEGAVNQVK